MDTKIPAFITSLKISHATNSNRHVKPNPAIKGITVCEGVTSVTLTEYRARMKNKDNSSG